MVAMCDSVCGVDKVDGDNFRHADGKIKNKHRTHV